VSTQLATLEQRVKDQVQGAIANLIPDDELSRLVEAQVQHFRANKLQELIQGQIRAKFEEVVKAELLKPEYSETWSNGQMAASEIVKQVITESAGDILNSMIGMHAQQIINRMRGGY
jgi:Txe/YoeB family toxin of Txe-Axe toxin-antitoxin module